MKKIICISLFFLLMVFLVSCSDSRENAVLIYNDTNEDVILCFALQSEIIDFSVKSKEQIIVNWDKVGYMQYMYIAKNAEEKDCINLNYKIEHIIPGVILVINE